MRAVCYPVVSTWFGIDILMSKYGSHNHIRITNSVINVTYIGVLRTWLYFRRTNYVYCLTTMARKNMKFVRIRDLMDKKAGLCEKRVIVLMMGYFSFIFFIFYSSCFVSVMYKLIEINQ